MIRIDCRWGDKQPLWLTKASQYARSMHSDDEDRWFEEELGMTSGWWHEDGGINAIGWSIIFENDVDYTRALLRFA